MKTLDYVLTPSALKKYQQCPYKFEQTYITKNVKYTQSQAAKRGDALHKNMEMLLKGETDTWNEEMTRATAMRYLHTVQRLQQNGWQLYIESPLCISEAGELLDWREPAPRGFLRCRIDLYAVHPDKDFAVVLDWKTGKVWDLDTIQLTVNALCLQAVTGLSKYKMAFVYLDQGQTVDHSIDLPAFPFSQYYENRHLLTGELSNLYWTIDNIRQSVQDGLWVKRPNRLCGWCDVTGCPARMSHRF